MSEKIFLRRSLQDRDMEVGKKKMEADFFGGEVFWGMVVFSRWQVRKNQRVKRCFLSVLGGGF